MILYHKIKNSLVYRLPILYKFLITVYFKIKKTPPEVLKTDLYNLVIFTGAAHTDMLNVCLNSIYKKFNKLPHIYIITDLSLSEANCIKSISWFPKNHLTVISGKSCIDKLEKSTDQNLKQFALTNPLGLKLLAILHVLNFKKPLLYTDTDVIWYQDPFNEIVNFLSDPDFLMALSEDIQPAYDPRLIEDQNLKELSDKPYYCTGILLTKELNEGNLNLIRNLALGTIINSGHFTEQTILAFLNKQCGNRSLDKNKFILDLSDKQKFYPAKRSALIARHYVGEVRHLFWRDALFN